ncbi:TetR family transcriptional regulator C-terminal domain-containing protein [Bacillus cereus]
MLGTWLGGLCQLTNTHELKTLEQLFNQAITIFLRSIKKGEMKMQIGLIGDSLTEGRSGVSFVNILKRKYPSITFLNLGKPGETVKSLHTRLSKIELFVSRTFLYKNLS